MRRRSWLRWMNPLGWVVALPCCALLLHSQPPTRPAAPAQTLDRIQKQAETARQQNRMDDAIGLYKQGVALKPSWDEGWWALGTLNYDLDRFAEAADAFRRLVGIKSDVAVTWAMLGLCEYETKDYDKALNHLRRGVSLGLGQNQNIADVANFHLALLLTRFEQYEASMKLIALFAQRNMNHPSYTEAMGIAALRKPLLPSEVAPSDRQLIMDAGRAMYDAAALRTTEAGSDFKLLVEKYPTTPNIHYLYGSFLMFSDADGGLSEMKKELEISPSHVPAMVTIASEYIQRKQYKDGLPYAQKAAALDPVSFPAHAVLGRILVEGDIDPPKGLKELEEARKLAPTSPQVRIALATAYTKVGRKEDAAHERQEFLKLRKELDSKDSAGEK